MKVTIEKKTDQLNYEDFLGGVTRIITVAGVKVSKAESQYDIEIEGDKRVWRPPATVLKILVEAWTDEATTWVGHRAELYGDPDVMMTGKKVGGIRVSRLSHIDKPMSLMLTTTRGQKGRFAVDPLPDAPTPPTDAEIAGTSDQGQLLAWGQQFPNLRPALKARIDEIEAAVVSPEDAFDEPSSADQ